MSNYKTIQEVMIMTGQSERTIRRHLSDGLIKGYKIGGEWRFDDAQIKDYFEEKETKKNLASKAGLGVKQFINHQYRHSSDEQVCCIIDYFNKSALECMTIKKIVMKVSNKHRGIDMKLIDHNGDLRITLIGGMEYVTECLNELYANISKTS